METLEELLVQKVELEKRIADAQKAVKNEAIMKIHALMNDAGLTLADLKSLAKPPKLPTRAGKAAAVKYRDKQTGQTWAGRGLQPKWLRTALESGRAIDEFAV